MNKQERNGNLLVYIHILQHSLLLYVEFDDILVLQEKFYQFSERLKQRNLRAVDSLRRAKKDLEFLELNFIDQNTYLNELIDLNKMLKQSNRDLSKKLCFCTVDKENIQRNLTNQLNEAVSSAKVSSILR